MSDNKSGLFVKYSEENESQLIQEWDDGSYDPFSDALNLYDVSSGKLNLALLSFSDFKIDYICLAKKGKRVVTSKHRVEFSSILNLSSLNIDAVVNRLESKNRRFFIDATKASTGIIPKSTWMAVLEAIKAERPRLAEEIDRLISLDHFSGFRISGEAANLLLQEREALGISLDIFTGNNKLRDHVLSEWAPSTSSLSNIDEEASTATLRSLPEEEPSFLNGISKRYLQEESTLQHDLFNWDNMPLIHTSGVSEFKQGDRKLEVIYANKNALEHTLGVDLIYYNQAFELFVLVQYKLMKEESGVMMYRPNAQLQDELARMDIFYTSNPFPSLITKDHEYRFNDDGFMLKLVPNVGLHPATGELIKGMYISREYMNFLIGPYGPKGPQGGNKITFDNAPRYLTNSEFSSNIKAGWIGFRGVQSEKLKEVIKIFMQTGRALLVAVES